MFFFVIPDKSEILTYHGQSPGMTEDGLLLEEPVDMLCVVEGGVEVEIYPGNYAELFGDFPSEFSAQRPVLHLEGIHHLFLLCGREDADVNFVPS